MIYIYIYICIYVYKQKTNNIPWAVISRKPHGPRGFRTCLAPDADSLGPDEDAMSFST